MDHAIPRLDDRGLRQFGLTTGAIVAVLFGLFFPWLLERGIPLWPWVLFGLLAGLGLAAPRILRPVYTGWMRFGLFMSRITTPVIMGIVFYVILTPIGLIRRLADKDSLLRRFEDRRDTYRIPSQKVPKERLEKPF